MRRGCSWFKRRLVVDMTLIEIAAVVIVLSIVGVVVARAFASSRVDGINVFTRRHMGGERERS
jgi:hypothetical protein